MFLAIDGRMTKSSRGRGPISWFFYLLFWGFNLVATVVIGRFIWIAMETATASETPSGSIGLLIFIALMLWAVIGGILGALARGTRRR
jgi:hypothetical protein